MILSNETKILRDECCLSLINSDSSGIDDEDHCPYNETSEMSAITTMLPLSENSYMGDKQPASTSDFCKYVDGDTQVVGNFEEMDDGKTYEKMLQRHDKLEKSYMNGTNSNDATYHICKECYTIVNNGIKFHGCDEVNNDHLEGKFHGHILRNSMNLFSGVCCGKMTVNCLVSNLIFCLNTVISEQKRMHDDIPICGNDDDIYNSYDMLGGVYSTNEKLILISYDMTLSSIQQMQWIKSSILRPNDIIILIHITQDLIFHNNCNLQNPGMILITKKDALEYNKKVLRKIGKEMQRISEEVLFDYDVYPIIVPLCNISKTCIGSLICRFAEELNVDMIIVGFHKKNFAFFRNFFFGSISRYIYNHAICPVVVVKV